MKKLFLVLSSTLLMSLLTISFNSCKKETPFSKDNLENTKEGSDQSNAENTNQRFTGTFNAYEDCHGNKPYIFTMAHVSSSEIKITNLSKLGFTVLADVNGSTFTIPTQQVTSNNITYTVNGSGYIDDDVAIHINHVIVSGSNTSNCSAICIR